MRAAVAPPCRTPAIWRAPSTGMRTTLRCAPRSRTTMDRVSMRVPRSADSRAGRSALAADTAEPAGRGTGKGSAPEAGKATAVSAECGTGL